MTTKTTTRPMASAEADALRELYAVAVNEVRWHEGSPMLRAAVIAVQDALR